MRMWYSQAHEVLPRSLSLWNARSVLSLLNAQSLLNARVCSTREDGVYCTNEVY
jgi:hypothetical protein